MSKPALTEAFDHYGTNFRRLQRAVVYNAGGHQAGSLWSRKSRKAVDRAMLYAAKLLRWSGAGNNLFRQHLEQAFRDQLPVRAVIVRAEDPEAVDRGVDASTVKKSFAVRPELVGRVSKYDGDQFVIEFQCSQ